ncbi:9650_t:CDS:2, partial [Entrophospora sp. SA101]
MSQTNNNSCGNAGPSPGCNSSNGILGSTSNFNDNKTSIVNTTVSSSPQSSTNMNTLLSQHKFAQESQRHHNIVERIFGLISNLSVELRHYLLSWFSGKRIELVNSFISYRLAIHCTTNQYSPDIYDSKGKINITSRLIYEPDWGINAAAQLQQICKKEKSLYLNFIIQWLIVWIKYQILIYGSKKQGWLIYCFPFLISLGGKMQILEFDAQRQMETKAREAFFTFLYQKRTFKSALELKIRRDNIIQDSLNQISENVIDLKKSLRIVFIGEDGVDGGGLRKEWFLLLIRRLFDPQYGMFTWDEDSKYCWFNPASFENSDQYYLVGVIVGLAIYNSTILDVHFPLACYKKLFNERVGLEDLKVFKP